MFGDLAFSISPPVQREGGGCVPGVSVAADPTGPARDTLPPADPRRHRGDQGHPLPALLCARKRELTSEVRGQGSGVRGQEAVWES